jgi:hypothetical protein
MEFSREKGFQMLYKDKDGKKEIIGNCPYRILEIIRLPESIQDELSDSCKGNDTGRIINPEYYPELKKWLSDNGYDSTECFIGWWSW